MKISPLTRILLLALIVPPLLQCTRNHPADQQINKYVVVLSLDGFRWDYPDIYPTPSLDAIAETGVKAVSLQASFPTKTFPNHFTMATGLYPDHHGIVQNSFFDPSLERFYSISDRDGVEYPIFYSGEPIWVTAEKQNMISASYFWVGSEAPVKGIQPTYWKVYDHYFPFESRLDSVLSWLRLPVESRPQLIMWYMDEPDGDGHYFGPGSKDLGSTIVYLDSLVGVFLDAVQSLPIADQINIIVTSDHGMASLSEDRYVDLTEYIDTSLFEIIVGYNPNYILKADAGLIEECFEDLQDIPNVSAWKSENVPARFKYGSNPSTLDFVLLADSSWTVGLGEKSKSFSLGGHGYDNRNPDMHAIFYATGPDFQNGMIQPTFENVDIYPLIAHILDLEPAPTDGNFERVNGMLIGEQ
jgi:predicted AlkP superfamily pyrophosphatase or phosphodiesterase